MTDTLTPTEIADGKIPLLDPSQPAKTAKAALKKVKEILDDAFRIDYPIDILLAARTRAVDQLLKALWDGCEWGDSEVCLIALGGYGRGELHPHSDIDLMILCAKSPEDHRHAVERFITSVWDSGLQLGHSVRTDRELLGRSVERHYRGDKLDGGSCTPR
jgi:[protein-PII] uridylyltransferase